MSTAAPLRIRSLSMTQNPATAQALCGRSPTANSNRSMNTPRPAVSVEGEQWFVDFVPEEIRHGRVLKVPLGEPLSAVCLPLLR